MWFGGAGQAGGSQPVAGQTDSPVKTDDEAAGVVRHQPQRNGDLRQELETGGLVVPQQQQQQPTVHQQHTAMTTTSQAADSSLHLHSSSSSNSTASSTQAKSPEPKISFHLKTSIFTRRITIDSDKMALGLIKQLAIAFLNEIYFQQAYPTQTYIGDYLRRHFSTNDNLNLLYERIILRKYSPEHDTFQPFYSAGDIQPESCISIEISARDLLPGHQQQAQQQSLASSIGTISNLSPSTSGQQQAAPPVTPTSQLKISHDFHTESYFMPTHCVSCSALIKGVFKQGFQCAVCRKNYCPKCKLKAEATGEGCLAALAMIGSSVASNSALLSASHQQQSSTLTSVSSNCDSGNSSASSNVSPNTNNAALGQASHTSAAANNNNNKNNPGDSNKLEIAGQHVNMSKRKSASNLLHFTIANPFKSHHNNNSASGNNAQSQQNVNNEPRMPSSSKSMRGSAGALDPILQQLSKQMRDQQQGGGGGKLVSAAAAEQQRSSVSSQSGNKLLNVQATQLSSSHQNLYTISDRDRESESGCVSDRPLAANQNVATLIDLANVSASAHQSPSKLDGSEAKHQLSNSARNSIRDLVHSPTRRTDQASQHQFISLDWIQLSGRPLCGVCSKPLNGSQSKQQAPLMCKTCKLQVHGQCQDLALADCLSRLAESSRAAAAESAGQQQVEGDDEQQQGEHKTGLKNTNSNVSRDNIRLHRLAPSVKHVKRPDLTKPIIEGWLQHKTLSDEQTRRHYWRLDQTDITLYENDTSTRYFKAIALNKITRVISAGSLPKQIKEDVALSGNNVAPLVGNKADEQNKQQQETKAKSANTSPLKTSEFRAQMEAMFAFELTTGSVYLVQAPDPNEANKWKGSLEAITAKKLAERVEVEKAHVMEPRPPEVAAAAVSKASEESSGKKTVATAQAQAQTQGQPEEQTQKHANVLGPSVQQQQQQMKADEKQARGERGHHHHHHHHHHGSSSSSSGAYRGQHKTYTDPNRSRLYNRPRIVIKLDPMSIPDHWIEGKYLIERNRNKGVGFEELGSGQFGKVYAAISEIKAEDPSKGLWSGVPVAIKEISKARFDLRQQAKLKNEANILSRLDHPGVIILERVHDLPDKLYIVMEQLEDDMLEMIVSTEEKRLNERVTKFLTYQILEALKYLHSQNIAHCDLKPENVLLCERRSQFPQIKLCDFGFAKIIEENSFRSSLVGTPAYLAPEVVKGERYNRSVDLWSVGVIVYVSLSGEFPFNEGENIHDQISRANFMYPEQPWARISQQAKNFINSLLRVNSDRRLSANRAQLDDWIQDFQLWCDLCELELRLGRRWVTDDVDFERWSRYARQHRLQVPRAAIQLHQELSGE